MRGWKWWAWALVATAVSSILGTRGWLEIWLSSAVADAVFIAGSLGAFAATTALGRRWRFAWLLAFPFHWAVYALSWMMQDLELPTQGDEWLFVLEIGALGLVSCLGSSYLLARQDALATRKRQGPAILRDA